MHLVCFKEIINTLAENFQKELSKFCLMTDRYIRNFFQKYNRIDRDNYNYNFKIIG